MVDSTGGGLVLFFSGIDRGSPGVRVFSTICRWRRLRWLDTALRCCGPRRSVERGAHKCSSVCSWAFWVLPLRGPCWTSNAQEREVSGVQGAQGCGVLTWECAGSLAGGNIFLSVPLDGTVLLFAVPVSAGDLDGLAGRAGGVSKVPYQGAPSSGYEE